MSPSTIIVSANLAWNLTNFRAGLIAALINDGYHVIAAAPEDPIHRKVLEDMGCRFVPIAVDAKGLSPYTDLATLAAYVRLFHRVKPAAYLGWTIKPNIYGAIAARICNVPTIHNVSGLGTAFIRKSIITRIVRMLYRGAFKKASTVFFQNESDKILFITGRLVRRSQARLLAGSGIALSNFVQAQSDCRPRGRFIMIARLLADKGVLEYVEAARIVRSEFADAHFTLAGFLDVANRTAISRTQVEDWVREGVIEYLPPVDDVRPLIESADCVVLPSYREGTSRILLEAAAMGRPVIASDVPGCREVIENGITGFLCSVRDPASLANAMRDLLSLSDGAWASMGRAGRQKVSKEFGEEQIIDAYREALSSVSAADLR